MKRIFILLILLPALTVRGNAQRLVKAGMGYSGTSVNTTAFRNSSIVTDRDTQYISYYDPEGYVMLGKRKLGSAKWTVSRTQYKGNITDAHNVISIMTDGKGYLHVAFDHHGHKLNYARSTSPGALTLGNKLSMTGRNESDVTYPEFYRLGNGDLLFAYRSGASGRGNLILNRYDTENGTWERVQDILIDGEGQRSAYWQLCTDKNGGIHLSWVWRETWMVETNHDLCYAFSPDEGETWYKSNGEKYNLPIRKDNAEYACRIPQGSELINQTGMCADTDGHPYIVTYWREAESEIPQYRLVWNDGKEWRHHQIMERSLPFTLKGGGTKMIPIARPKIVADNGRAWFIFRDAERANKVSMAYTPDIAKGEWEVTDLTSFSVGAWEPSIDTELWKQEKKLHIFVQETHQGDGEKTVDAEPTPIYVMEVK